MSSVRMWLGSGSVLAGVGAAMLCGAGLASADTGSDSRSDQASANAAADSSPAPQRGAHRGSQRSSAASVRTAADRVQNTRVVASSPVNRPAAAALAATVRPASLAAAVAAAPSAVKTGVVASPAAAPAAAVASAAVQPAPVAKAASTPVVPSTVPVDPAKFAGTYYEQGSVKQFFSFGLVNTKAVYTLKSDGTIGVQNSGNYFFNRGPRSSIVGSAVPVNAINTALNVSFLPGSNSAKPPGNYTILANAADYSWVIVSDPSGKTGYILTRSKTIPTQDYQKFVTQARSLGVTGRITPTVQYPA